MTARVSRVSDKLIKRMCTCLVSQAGPNQSQSGSLSVSHFCVCDAESNLHCGWLVWLARLVLVMQAKWSTN